MEAVKSNMDVALDGGDVSSRENTDEVKPNGFRRGTDPPQGAYYNLLASKGAAIQREALGILREVDGIVADASYQLERYQKRLPGSIQLSYRVSERGLVLRLVEFVGSKMTPREMSAKRVAEWSVRANWVAKGQKNPGRPMKRVVRALHDLVTFRASVVSVFGSRPVWPQAIRQRWPTLRRELFEALDSLGTSLQKDWAKEGGGDGGNKGAGALGEPD